MCTESIRIPVNRTFNSFSLRPLSQVDIQRGLSIQFTPILLFRENNTTQH